MEKRKSQKSRNLGILVVSIIIGAIAYYFSRGIVAAGVTFIIVLILLTIYFGIRGKLKRAVEIKKMEQVFPDFIELVSSNLRSGMTIDKALLLSSRKEFAPLDQEILQLGKDITTGKGINVALQDMAKRIGSERINKTTTLIISGLKSGGNLAILLEETASNLREREFVEKKAASSVLMYVIFIFFAVAVGSPVLFGLSSVLVEVLTKLLANVPSSAGQANFGLPFTLSHIGISMTFITYFSISFILITDILASLLLGLVNKGEEKEGIKYILPLMAIGVTLYFVIRGFLAHYFSGLFA